MNQKLVLLLGSVVTFHFAAGALFFAGGCAQEDPPMPPGIYVPKHGNALQKPEQQDPLSVPANKDNGQFATPESVIEPQQAVAPKTEIEQKPAPTPAAPAPAKKTAVQAEGKAYKVVKGDSLWRLSRKFGVTMENIAVFNGIAVNSKLYIGQTLMIPEAGQKITEASPKAKKFVRAKRTSKKAVRKGSARKGKTVKAKSAVRPRAIAALPADGVYVVKSGDNFTVIARRFGLKVSDIQNANPNVNSSRLKIGQKLRLASSASGNTAEKAVSATSAEAPAQGNTAATENSAAVSAPAANVTKDSESADMDKLLGSVKTTENASGAKTETKAAADAASSATDSFIEGADKNKYIKLEDGTSAIRMGEEMTVSDFCKKYGVDETKLLTLNPTLPLDGKLKSGLLVKLP